VLPGLVVVKFRVVCVGRPRDRALAERIGMYEKRAARYWPLDIVEVREGQGRDPELVRRQEGERLREAVGASLLVACDEHGAAFGSEEFAKRMQGWREAAHDVTFVIGGAFGIEASLLAGAQALQLARWTLPHELARLVLAEQLYRAGTIVRREPYHKSG
jgi:23S rRNA (pseudouridine1915-N3)-methyltransferase